MAITYPREMPCPVAGPGPVFAPVYMDARALTGGGGPQVVQLGPVLWRGRWAIPAAQGGPIEAWFAWAASLRGGLRLFKGRPKRRWPLSRPRGFEGLTVGGLAFTGSGAVAAIGPSRDVVTVSGLPDGLQLSPGDFISLPVGPRQHLHEVLEAATVAGGSVALTVEPPLHLSAAVGAAVLLDGPWCDMALTAAPDRALALATGTITFEGMQVLI